MINKALLLVLVSLLLAFTTRDSAVNSTSVIISSQSSLFVKGTSNINAFSCSYNTNKLKNPIQVVYQIEDGKMKFNKAALILDNVCFDCGGKGINNDFQEILKSQKYPQMFLFLKEISFIDNEFNVRAKIRIEIAGVTNDYEIPVKIKKDLGLLLTGDLSISLVDYNLVAPKKLFGLIQVHDKIEIFFQLAVKKD
jgi:hypothetical protein